MAMYSEGLRGPRWVGVGGTVELGETSTGGSCPKVPPRGTCLTAGYAAAVAAGFKPARGGDVVKRLSLGQTLINGVKLAP
jgi:hypothetical protein